MGQLDLQSSVLPHHGHTRHLSSNTKHGTAPKACSGALGRPSYGKRAITNRNEPSSDATTQVTAYRSCTQLRPYAPCLWCTTRVGAPTSMPATHRVKSPPTGPKFLPVTTSHTSGEVVLPAPPPPTDAMDTPLEREEEGGAVVEGSGWVGDGAATDAPDAGCGTQRNQQGKARNG
jgi:hypothetical protein